MSSKLFLGHRLRRLRRDHELSQTDMAQTLAISPSYLNHLERNQRPVTAALLLKLAELYEVDVRTFAANGGARTGPDALAEIFSDALLSDLGVPRYELAELANNAPAIADAIARLYGALKEAARNPEIASAGDARALVTPENWVRDYIQQHRNYYPALEEAAETLGGALSDPLSMAEPMRRRLKEAWGISARVVPQDELGNVSQQYDQDRRLFLMSSQLRPENRTFALAYQLALVEFAAVLERLVAEAAPPDEGVRQLLHMSLANYAAGAIMMPYGRFLASAEQYRFSIDRLCGEYGANVEQVAHRLTTLNRPGARGVPFFMLRVDPAGNISKRYAGENFPFSRFGGTCPRWNLHAAFQANGQVVTQLIETPDGQRFFTVARTIERPIKSDLSGGLLAIGLGCDIRHAHRLHCAEGYDLERAPVTPVGPACAICPRIDCGYRATPPAGRMLAIDRTRKTISPFPFVAG
ncbi:short-chain fatty acyl-CoA regulator family protein [Sphingomonas sp. RB56-2]|uniref:Short-chain fatty acyl-CoA regulator family protein n=1 Tax=Sphingomonas brevis TaxID=2908206 RepID=A0ABT0SC26_9SPHN|nr:short-chain fatty acyl-CoA regulator family protein [Sphingomonas brevis]MCL6741635.1 short-chain fatty acyl-CoA regulator family protein [Sphingomonas brevis]